MDIKWLLQQFLWMTSARTIGKRLIVRYKVSASMSSKRQNRLGMNKLFIFCSLQGLEIYIHMVLKDALSQLKGSWRHIQLLVYFPLHFPDKMILWRYCKVCQILMMFIFFYSQTSTILSWRYKSPITF